MIVILASTSPTRKALLSAAGLNFATVAPTTDERALCAAHPEWRAEDIAPALARAKALDVSGRSGDALVIGADQTLVLDGTAYAKPVDLDDARRQLRSLRGRTHELRSALSAARRGETVWSHESAARLTMRDWSETFLDHYVGQLGHELLTTVGGYKVEGLGIQLFSRIEGDHSTILGLPLLPLLGFLRSEGAIAT